jgi:hypothetical protein
MAAKKIIYFRQAILRGVNQLADAARLCRSLLSAKRWKNRMLKAS